MNLQKIKCLYINDQLYNILQIPYAWCRVFYLWCEHNSFIVIHFRSIWSEGESITSPLNRVRASGATLKSSQLQSNVPEKIAFLRHGIDGERTVRRTLNEGSTPHLKIYRQRKNSLKLGICLNKIVWHEMYKQWIFFWKITYIFFFITLIIILVQDTHHTLYSNMYCFWDAAICF